MVYNANMLLLFIALYLTLPDAKIGRAMVGGSSTLRRVTEASCLFAMQAQRLVLVPRKFSWRSVSAVSCLGAAQV